MCEHENVLIAEKENLKFTVMALHGARGKLIGVIGDEDTCVGFLLGGIGDTPLLIVEKYQTKPFGSSNIWTQG